MSIVRRYRAVAPAGRQLEIEWFPSQSSEQPIEIARQQSTMRSGIFDVVIVDTAGRLAIDEAMMAEIRRCTPQSIRSKPCLL